MHMPSVSGDRYIILTTFNSVSHPAGVVKAHALQILLDQKHCNVTAELQVVFNCIAQNRGKCGRKLVFWCLARFNQQLCHLQAPKCRVQNETEDDEIG